MNQLLVMAALVCPNNLPRTSHQNCIRDVVECNRRIQNYQPKNQKRVHFKKMVKNDSSNFR